MAIGNPEGLSLLTVAWGQLQTDCSKLRHHYSMRRQYRLWSRMRSESHFATPHIGLCLQIRTGLLVSNSLDTLRDMTSEPPLLAITHLGKLLLRDIAYEGSSCLSFVLCPCTEAVILLAP